MAAKFKKIAKVSQAPINPGNAEFLSIFNRKWHKNKIYCLPHHVQSVKEAVKNTGWWAKQALLRLETRVQRPDKEKMEQLEAEVRGQEGEGK